MIRTYWFSFCLLVGFSTLAFSKTVYVSKDSCRGKEPTGTKEDPYCTIGRGIENGDDVRVALAKTPYVEHLAISKGTVEGGYDSKFIRPGSERTAVLGSVEFPHRAKGILRRFSVDQGIPEKPFKELLVATSAIRVEGSAEASLENVTVNQNSKSGLVMAKNTSGVVVIGGDRGKLRLTDCVIHGLNGEAKSVGVSVGATNYSLIVENTTITAGSAKLSLAAGYWGNGTADWKKVTMRPGEAPATAGLRAVGSGAIRLALKVTESDIEGSHKVSARDRSYSYPGSHYGIAVRDADLEVRKSKIVGTLLRETAETRAIEMRSSVPGKLVVEGNPSIIGGPTESTGGSLDAAAIYANGDSAVTVRENELVIGCTHDCHGQSTGVLLHTLLTTSDRPGILRWGDFEDPKKAVLASPKWDVSKNETIAGAQGQSYSTRVGIYAISNKGAAVLTVRDNKYIVGNFPLSTGGGKPGTIAKLPEKVGVNSTVGMITRSTDATITGNRIASGAVKELAGTTMEEPGGLRVYGDAEGKQSVRVEGNRIEGDPSKGIGAEFIGTRATVQRNFIVDSSVGLTFHSDVGSRYVNNITIAEYGCNVGCSSYTTPEKPCRRVGDFTFAFNLCYAKAKKGWALLLGGRTEKARVANNILDGDWPVLRYHLHEFAENADFDHNVLVARFEEKCAVWEFGSWKCLFKKSSDYGTANVGIDPGYLGPLKAPWRAASFAPDAKCALKGTGDPIADVKLDYDNRARGREPIAGPFECAAK